MTSTSSVDAELMRLGADVAAALRQIETEADSEFPWRGVPWPTGLCNAGRHYRPGAGHSETETCIYVRLAELLRAKGWRVGTDVDYPRSSQECDLVVDTATAGRVWIEVKCAWKYGSASFSKHLYGSAHADIGKLASLTSSDADVVGFLLIGFDELHDPMDDDIVRFRENAGLDQSSWLLALQDQFDDFRRTKFNLRVRIRTWLWFRELSGE